MTTYNRPAFFSAGMRDNSDLPRNKYGEKILHRCINCNQEVVNNPSKTLVHFRTGYQHCDGSMTEGPIAQTKKGIKVKRVM